MCENKFITLSDTEEVYIYSGGYYQRQGDLYIKKAAQESLGREATNHRVNEIIGHVKRSTYMNRGKLVEPKELLCLKNGILNLKTFELKSFSPEKIFFNQLPINYDRNTKCPRIKRFLSQVVTKEDIKTMQEYFGYCLLKDMLYHSVLIFYGSGANGKSTLISVLRNFLGEENCTAVSLQDLDDDRFAASRLFGKLANLCPDLPQRAMRETSYFKMLTGNDAIDAQEKFKSRFSFKNYAKFVFSANQLPNIYDESDAVFRRLILIEFPHQFRENADPRILTKLITDKELSGLLNWAIRGLKRLQRNRGFSMSLSIDQIRKRYLVQSDSIRAFIQESVVVDVNSHIAKSELYDSYKKYCALKNIPAKEANAFHREFKSSISVSDYQPSANGKQISAWKGISLKEVSNKGDK